MLDVHFFLFEKIRCDVHRHGETSGAMSKFYCFAVLSRGYVSYHYDVCRVSQLSFHQLPYPTKQAFALELQSGLHPEPTSTSLKGARRISG
jgi:hypothetical protein